MSSTDIIARKDWTEKGGTELQMNEVVLGGNERNKSADGLPRTKKMNHSVSTSTRCLFNLWNRRIRDPMSRPPTKSAPRWLMSSTRVPYASRQKSEQLLNFHANTIFTDDAFASGSKRNLSVLSAITLVNKLFFKRFVDSLCWFICRIYSQNLVFYSFYFIHNILVRLFVMCRWCL